MKHIKILFIALLFLVSCSDFLDKTNPNELSTSSVWQSQDDVRASLNALYRLLPNPMPAGNPGGGELFYTILTEDGYSRFPQNWSGDLLITASSRQPRIEYDRFSRIRACNEFIFNVPGVDMDEALKTQNLAEARFIRAWYYARMSFLFGDVPLITEPTAPDFFPEKASRQAVFDFVMTELTDIANDLPWQYTDANDAVRISKGAALALKAQTALNALRWHPDTAFLYTEAREATEDIYNNGPYALEPGADGFANLFNKSTEGATSSETILTSVFDPDFRTHQMNRNIAVKNTYSGEGRGHGHQIGSTNAMAEAFQMLATGLDIHDPASGYDPADPYTGRDPRFDVTLTVPGENLPTQGSDGVTPTFEYQPHPLIPPTTNDIPGGAWHRTGYNFEKYLDYSSIGGTICDIDFKLIRFAEVILMYAESVLGETGNIALATSLVDEVRTRVGMPGVVASYGAVASTDAMLDIILTERRLEFAGEGPQRYFDIMRHSLAEEVFAKHPNVLSIPLGVDYRTTGTPDLVVLPGDLNNDTKAIIGPRNLDPTSYYTWPLPQNALDANPNL